MQKVLKPKNSELCDAVQSRYFLFRLLVVKGLFHAWLATDPLEMRNDVKLGKLARQAFPTPTHQIMPKSADKAPNDSKKLPGDQAGAEASTEFTLQDKQNLVLLVFLCRAQSVDPIIHARM